MKGLSPLPKNCTERPLFFESREKCNHHIMKENPFLLKSKSSPAFYLETTGHILFSLSDFHIIRRGTETG
jgi:hypothetical protein